MKNNLRTILWALRLAFRIDAKLFLLWGGISVALSVLPAVALSFNKHAVSILSTFLLTGTGEFRDVVPSIVALGIVLTAVGISKRLNADFLYFVMYDSYYFGLEEYMMDAVGRVEMKTLMDKRYREQHYTCMSRCGSLADFMSGGCLFVSKLVTVVSLLVVAAQTSTVIFLISVAYLVGVMVLNVVTAEKVRWNNREYMAASRLSDYYQSSIMVPGVAKELRVYGLQKETEQNWSTAYENADKIDRRFAKMRSLVSFISNITFYIFITGMLAYCIYRVANGSMSVDVFLMLYAMGQSISDVSPALTRSFQLTDNGLYFLTLQRQFFESVPKDLDETDDPNTSTAESASPVANGANECAAASDVSALPAASGANAATDPCLANESSDPCGANAATDPCLANECTASKTSRVVYATSETVSVFSAEHVSFSYDDTTEVLHDVSFELKKGETVALVGLNGSGKSTLVKLLIGLFVPTKGVLRFYGTPYGEGTQVDAGTPDEKGVRHEQSAYSESNACVHTFTRHTLVHRVGMFFQDFHIFHATFRENVGFGDVKNVNNTEQILCAMDKGGATKLLSKMKLGLEQWLLRDIKKDGVMLSGGEKQRIAVSRAHMSDKEILIFDEPAAALDPIAEMQQFQAIREKINGRTAILISHRVGFARLADRILVLDHGRLVETGTHEELMAANGVYAGFYNEQASWYQREEGESNE